jgi:hypothetical protein
MTGLGRAFLKVLLGGLLTFGGGLGAASPVRADTAGGTIPPHRTVVVSPDERVVLTFEPGRDPREMSRGPASAEDKAALPKMGHTVEELESFAVAAPPKPDRLTVSLWSSEAGGSQLRVDNGYDFPVIYRAFLVFERDGRRLYRPTSICPVRPHQAGVENWGDHVVAIALTGFEAVSPDNMACNDGSVLTVSPQPPQSPDLYICGSEETATQPPPLSVALSVDAAGSVQLARATWTVGDKDVMHSPVLLFDYPLMGDVPVPRPDLLSVVAAVRMLPPPKPMSARIVLLLDGVEAASRPWRRYADARASISQAPKNAVAILGEIPFIPDPNNPADAGLTALLNAIGEPGHRVQVRVVGDDGSILADAAYPVDQPAVRAKARLDAVLAEALAKTKTLAQCKRRED